MGIKSLFIYVQLLARDKPEPVNFLATLGTCPIDNEPMNLNNDIGYTEHLKMWKRKCFSSFTIIKRKREVSVFAQLGLGHSQYKSKQICKSQTGVLVVFFYQHSSKLWIVQLTLVLLIDCPTCTLDCCSSSGVTTGLLANSPVIMIFCFPNLSFWVISRYLCR